LSRGGASALSFPPQWAPMKVYKNGAMAMTLPWEVETLVEIDYCIAPIGDFQKVYFPLLC